MPSSRPDPMLTGPEIRVVRYIQIQFKGTDDEVSQAIRTTEWFVRTDTRTRFVVDGTIVEEVEQPNGGSHV